MGIKARLRWPDEAGGRGSGFARQSGWVLCLIGLIVSPGAASAQEGPVTASPPTPGPFGLTPGAFTTAPGAFGAPPPIAGAATPGAAAAPLAIPAVPPAWLLTPALTLGQTFDDNVNLAPAGSRMWDFITSITPELDLAGNTGRTTVALTYDPQALIFARSSPNAVLQQRLLGTGTATLWPETLFFDASAGIGQTFLRPTAPVGLSTITTSNNLTTTYATNASPYLREHLGSIADSESRYRFTTASTSAPGIADEQTHELRQTLVSGDAFGRLGGQLTGDFTRLNRGHDPTDPLSGISSKDELARADLHYPVYGAVSIVGGVGWERITDPTLSPQPKGLIWDAGFAYQPNPLVAVSLTYGRRFSTTDIEFNGTYNLDPALRLSAIYTQTVQTSLSQIAGTTNQTTIDPVTGRPVAAGGTAPTTGTLSSFGISSGSFLAKTAELAATLIEDRNTYSATLTETTQHATSATQLNAALSLGGQSQILATSASLVTAQRIVGGGLTWARQMWPDLTTTAGASYYRTTFLDGSGRNDNTYALSLAFTYLLSRTASATLSLSRLDLRSNIAVDSLVDNTVTATIRKQF